MIKGFNKFYKTYIKHIKHIYNTPTLLGELKREMLAWTS